MLNDPFNYSLGYVIAKNDIELSICYDINDKYLVKKGDKLDIIYDEVDGSLELTLNGILLSCTCQDRASFEEYCKYLERVGDK